jgi:hypothetical protein
MLVLMLLTYAGGLAIGWVLFAGRR